QSVPAAISLAQTACKNHSLASPFLASPSASCLPRQVRLSAPPEYLPRSCENSLPLIPSHILAALQTESPQTRIFAQDCSLQGFRRVAPTLCRHLLLSRASRFVQMPLRDYSKWWAAALPHES